MPADVNRPIWTPGAVIRLLHMHRERIWSALPVTVLADGPEATVIRISAGTMWLAAVNHAGQRVHLNVDDWTLAKFVWTGDDCTYVIRPGRWCAVGWFSPADSAGPGRYYINGQRPPTYEADELHTLDLELDAELSPPGYQTRWKDNDLLRRARGTGSITAEEEDHMITDMTVALDALPEGPDGILLRNLAAVRVPPAHLPTASLDAAAGARL